MKKKGILVTFLLICAIIIVGCSSQSSSPSSTTTPATTVPASPSTTMTTSSTAAAASTTSTQTTVKPSSTTTSTQAPASTTAPRYGGTLKFIYWNGPKTPGGIPWELYANELLSVQFCIEPLVHTNYKGESLPCLAESFKVADDLKSITFYLRKGVKFVDGTDFNAVACKWNLDKTIESKSQPIWKSVDIIDDYTVRLNLNYWQNTVTGAFDGTATWMISPTAYQKNGADWARSNPTGTGPFKFASFEKDVHYKVVKNPNYWQKGKPYLDGIHIIYASETTVQRTVMQSGEADVCEVEPGKVASDFKNLGLIIEMHMTSVHCLLPDTAHKDSPFANKKVREAVEYAINRDAISKAFSYGFWPAPNQIPALDNPAFNPNFNLGRKYDKTKAKQLMTEAGYGTGFKATLEVLPVGYDRNIPLAIQSDLSEIGINIEVVIPPMIPKFLEDSNSIHNALLMQPIFGGTNFNSALSFAINPTITPFSQNLIWERSPEYTDLFNKSITAPKADVELMRKVGDFLIKEATVIPIMCGGSGYAHPAYVKDGGWYSRGCDWSPEDIWLDKK